MDQPTGNLGTCSLARVRGGSWALPKRMRAGGSSTARSWLNGSNTCQAP